MENIDNLQTLFDTPNLSNLKQVCQSSPDNLNLCIKYRSEILTKVYKNMGLSLKEIINKFVEKDFIEGIKYLFNKEIHKPSVVLDMIKSLEKSGENIHFGEEYILQLSAKNGYLDIVKYLVEHGANVHAGGDDALISSAQYGHLEVVKYLVQQGADINARLRTYL